MDATGDDCHLISSAFARSGASSKRHIHLLVTDGGFRADGTFVPWPAHDTVALTEAFRRAVLRLFG
jgi:hypothetical protein